MNSPRWTASSRPTVPGASPRVDADDVYTTRRTPAGELSPEADEVLGGGGQGDGRDAEHHPLIDEQGSHRMRVADDGQEDPRELHVGLELAPDRRREGRPGGHDHPPQAEDEE